MTTVWINAFLRDARPGGKGAGGDAGPETQDEVPVQAKAREALTAEAAELAGRPGRCWIDTLLSRTCRS